MSVVLWISASYIFCQYFSDFFLKPFKMANLYLPLPSTGSAMPYLFLQRVQSEHVSTNIESRNKPQIKQNPSGTSDF